MASFNKVVLVGNLTRDIELRYLTSGTAVADAGLAINETWKDAGGNKVEDVSFIDCTLWGRTAEIAGQYLAKGSQVLFEGRLKQERWEDKDSGEKRQKVKVVVERMTMLGSPRGGGDGGGGGERRPPQGQQRGQRREQDQYSGPSSAGPEPDQYPPPDDEIPFGFLPFLVSSLALGASLIA